MKLRQIHPRVFVSGRTRDTPAQEVFNLIRNADIKYVLNVDTQPDLALRAMLVPTGIAYRHYPLTDGKTVHPNVCTLAEDLRRAMGWTNVLVHCYGGRNRSILVAVLAIAMFDNRHPLDVLTGVRDSRPTALCNPAFESYLERWDSGAGRCV